jgi:hypothetical protein
MSLLNRPVYLARLTTVIEKFSGLEPADTTSLWRELLREHSVQYWVTVIDSCTIDTFKALVEGVFPPTPEKLLQLEYQQTDKPRRKLHKGRNVAIEDAVAKLKGPSDCHSRLCSRIYTLLFMYRTKV